MEKIILHSDLNNFYASVECLLNPSYREVPLAVAGNPEARHGVVLAKNAIAKASGVKTGDVIWEAEQKCPGLIIVPPHFSLYEKYSRMVFEIYTRFTPQVEPFGPDECWLDMTGCSRLFGSPTEMAQKILETVKKETGLTVSVGISFSKYLAKLCSDLASPDGFFEANAHDYRQKLWQLPAKDIMMVGRKTAEKLKKVNILTIGDLANADDGVLKRLLGINGLKIKQAANGTDGEGVREAVKSRAVLSVGHGTTTIRDVTNYDDLYSLICFLSDKISARLVKYGVRGAGVSIDLRTNELRHTSKQVKLSRPIYSGTDIAENSFALAKDILKWEFTPLRSVSIAIFDLSAMDGAIQTSFFEQKQDKREKLELALDKIRHKYGRETIVRANIIEKDFICDKNDSEDFLPFKR